MNIKKFFNIAIYLYMLATIITLIIGISNREFMTLYWQLLVGFIALIVTDIMFIESYKKK